MENIHIVNTGSWADDFCFENIKDAAAFYELALKAKRIKTYYIGDETYYSEGEVKQVLIKSGALCTGKEIENLKEAIQEDQGDEYEKTK